MKIRDIISEAKEDDLDRRMDAYFRRKAELEREKERRSQLKKSDSAWKRAAYHISQGKQKSDQITGAVSRAWDRFSRHPLVTPK